MTGDKQLDKHFSLDALTDYANEHGDQAVIDNMLAWLHDKMGSKWLIINANEDVKYD